MQVFVSYSRAQFYLAEDLALDLGHNGFDAWLDVHRLKPGDEWDGAIVAALRASEAVVLVASREALASPHVHAELDLAQQLGKPVIVALASRVDLPSTLADAPRIDLRREFESGVRRLSAVLDEGDDAAPISAIPSSWGARAGVVRGVSAVLLGVSLLFAGLCLLSLGVQLSDGDALSMVDAVNSALFGALSGWLWWTFSRRRAGSTILLGVAFAIAAPAGAFLGCLFVYLLVVAVQQGDVLGVVVDTLEVGIAWAPLVVGVSALRSASFYHWLPTGDAPRWMRRRMLARRGHHVVPAPQSAEVPVTYDLRCHEIDGAVQRSLDGALRAHGHSPTEAASADRTIVVLSNLSPVDWLDRTLRQLGGKAAILVVSAPVSASALEHFERYHWLDYRGRNRSTLDRLAARIGDVRTVVGAELVPENFARRVLPWGVRVYSGFLVFGATPNLSAGFAGLAGADLGDIYGATGSPLVPFVTLIAGAVLLWTAVALVARRIRLRRLVTIVVGFLLTSLAAAAASLPYWDIPAWWLLPPLAVSLLPLVLSWRALRDWLPPHTVGAEGPTVAAGDARWWRLPATRGMVVVTAALTLEFLAVIPDAARRLDERRPSTPAPSVAQDPTPASPSSLERASDRIVAGTGYTVTRPAHWMEATNDSGIDIELDLALARDGLAGQATVVVFRYETPGAGMNDLGAAWNSVRAAGARHLTSAKRTELDGETTARTFGYRLTVFGEQRRLRRVVVIHDEIAYEVALAAPPRSYRWASKDFAAILRSWHWTS